MGLWLRTLCFGVLPMLAMGRNADAQRLDGAASQLRTPVTPVTVMAEPQSGLEEELRRMSEQAGIIFAGQVMGIDRPPDVGLGAGPVSVTFRVEEAIRGCSGSTTFVLREWAGLWTGGSTRYHTGQRLLMLLHPLGALGLTSPVGGQDGAIPISGGGASPDPQDGAIGSGGEAVDLRWVEARLVRPGGSERFYARPVAPLDPASTLSTLSIREDHARMEPVAAGGDLSRKGISPGDGTPAEGAATSGNTMDPMARMNVSAPGSIATIRPLRSVLAMLGAWQAGRPDATR